LGWLSGYSALTYWLLYYFGLLSYFLKNQETNYCFPLSAKAEYRSMATTACEIIWLRTLLHDLMVPISSSAQLYCDNRAAIHIAANPVLPFILLLIQCIMNAQSISRSTVTLFGIVSNQGSLLQHTFLLNYSLLTSSPKLSVPINSRFLLASWAFVTSMLQLERAY